VLVSKYGDQLPLYRQSDIYAREGVDLSRSTLTEVGRPSGKKSEIRHFIAELGTL